MLRRNRAAAFAAAPTGTWAVWCGGVTATLYIKHQTIRKVHIKHYIIRNMHIKH